MVPLAPAGSREAFLVILLPTETDAVLLLLNFTPVTAAGCWVCSFAFTVMTIFEEIAAFALLDTTMVAVPAALAVTVPAAFTEATDSLLER